MSYQEQVEQLFKKSDHRHSQLCLNPVTGGHFLRGVDSIRRQKRLAERALGARDWFAPQRPPDAPDLPLTDVERERNKVGGISYIVALLARSLAMRDYETKGHPRFEEYARGVMASPYAEFLRNDPHLLREYPPTPLPGLGGGLIWRRPKQ
jgi:hypothetical protein